MKSSLSRYWHCSHSIRDRVYLTARCPSVCPSYRPRSLHAAATVCCCEPSEHAIFYVRVVWYLPRQFRRLSDRRPVCFIWAVCQSAIDRRPVHPWASVVNSLQATATDRFALRLPSHQSHYVDNLLIRIQRPTDRLHTEHYRQRSLEQFRVTCPEACSPVRH